MDKVQKEDHFSNTLHIYYKEITNIAFHREWKMTKFTSHINTNEMQLFLFSLFGVRTLHVSDAFCVHHQDHYKL